MVRRTRKRYDRKLAARARREREQLYADLEDELHREWQQQHQTTGTGPEPVMPQAEEGTNGAADADPATDDNQRST